MEYLEEVYVGGDMNLVDFRFPVQYVIRPDHSYRGYAGQIVSGVIEVGEEVMALPSMKKSRIASIDLFSGSNGKGERRKSAFAPMSIALTLEDELDLARGDMLVRSNNVPKLRNQFEAMVVWMHDEPMDPEKSYLIMHTTRQSKVFVDEIKYRTDVNTLHRLPGAPLALNEIGRIAFNSAKPLLIDTYDKNHSTGSFILVDPGTFLTVAAGMIIERLPQELMPLGKEKPARISQHIHDEVGVVTRSMREKACGFSAVTLWFTGLSGSGKSSIAKELELELFQQGRPIYRLDGDNLRFGLNRDLGFSREHRTENIRRAAEVARLLNQAGVSVICAFISPFEKDREAAKEIIGQESFIEVFVDTPLDLCERRDPNGLYQKARAGEIREFTGISSPYEAPQTPDVRLATAERNIKECVQELIEFLARRA
jgi:bifunctional enzyme CysN/CysC